MRKTAFALCVLTALGGLLAGSNGFGCTAICLQDRAGWVAAFNHDWVVKDALIMTNKRGVSKVAAPPEGKGSTAPPVRWTSSYGSVTFNQYGREFPSDGMNEKGLFVAILLLEQSRWPALGSRAAIKATQWIQYQLDTSSTVQEVLDSAGHLQIAGSSQPGELSSFHFLACDRTGACVTVEGLDGKLVLHTQKELPVRALTNTPYAQALEALECGKPVRGDVYHSETRFIEAAGKLREAAAHLPGSAVERAFATLEAVESHDELGPTVWSSVYDLANLRVHFKTRDNRKVRHFDLSAFDFSCSSPVAVLDVLSDSAGDVSAHFVPYSRELNRKLISKTWSQTPGISTLPQEALELAVAYPETCACVR